MSMLHTELFYYKIKFCFFWHFFLGKCTCRLPRKTESAQIDLPTMSTSLSDSSYGAYYTHSFGFLAVVLFAAFYITGMKFIFGTVFPRKAYSNYKANELIRKRYYELFSTRDNLMYHISWSKSSGEMEEAKHLMAQLQKVDKVSY